MRINFREFKYLVAELAGDPKTEDYFFDDPAGASNPYILVTAGTVFVKL
jgi:hypothetical protein